jgi:hypothetical protein
MGKEIYKEIHSDEVIYGSLQANSINAMNDLNVMV